MSLLLLPPASLSLSLPASYATNYTQYLPPSTDATDSSCFFSRHHHHYHHHRRQKCIFHSLTHSVVWRRFLLPVTIFFAEQKVDSVLVYIVLWEVATIWPVYTKCTYEFSLIVYTISRSIYAPKIILRLTFNPLLHAPHLAMKLIIVKAVSFLVVQQFYRYGYSCTKTRFNSVFFSIFIAGKTKKKLFIVVRGKLENLGQRNDEALTS